MRESEVCVFCEIQCAPRQKFYPHFMHPFRMAELPRLAFVRQLGYNGGALLVMFQNLWLKNFVLLFLFPGLAER